MKLDQVTRPTIYVLIGLPGSGKSTWINTVNYSPNMVILSTDNYIEQKAEEEGKTYSEVFDRYIKEATQNLNAKFSEAIQNNMDIIHDQTNMSQKKRASILQRVPKNYIKIAVVFSVDDNELNRRLADRAEKTGKNIPGHIIQSMKQNYQEPSMAEGFDKIIRK